MAQVDIPPRVYVEVETGEIDEQGNPVKILQPVPLNMDKVTLTLWSVKE